MEEFIIEGGIPLSGEITPSGNKNAALPLLAACLLTDEPVVLRNVPQIRRSAVIANDRIGQQRERMRCRGAEYPWGLQAKTSPTIRMIDEDQLAAIRVRFFQRRELAGHGTKWLVCGMRSGGEHRDYHAQRHEPSVRWSGGVMEWWM